MSQRILNQEQKQLLLEEPQEIHQIHLAIYKNKNIFKGITKILKNYIFKDTLL